VASMILVDTSIWIDHLRRCDRQLAAVLEAGEVVCHPFVIGEIACGSLARRHVILELLHALPRTGQAEHHEILSFIDARRLHGCGIGLVDAHLLWASVNEAHVVWTRDARLRRIAVRLGVGSG
jgi:predicted nucleic acid-binding protein